MELLLGTTIRVVNFIVTTALLTNVAIPGIALAPFAALLAWYLARRRRLKGVREGLAGAAYSAFLVVPCILLIIALVKGRLPSSVVGVCFVALHIVWLIGPVAFWGLYDPELDHLFQGQDSHSPNLIRSSFDDIVFWVMVSLWVGSAFTTFKAWRLVEEVTVERLVSFRFMLPYALACLSVWTFYLTARFGIIFPDTCSELDAVLAGCVP